MQRINSVTLAPAAAVSNGIATSQTPASGGVQSLTLNGSLVTSGAAIMDIARRVVIASASDDSARTFIITGADRYGRTISESLKGPTSTVPAVSLKDYKTVTSITVDANTAGAITAGTSGAVSSQWFPVDRYSSMDMGIGVRMSGTANWSIEHTLEDPFTPGVGVQPNTGPVDFYLQPYQHPTLDQKTGNASGAYSTPISAVRLTLNSFSSTASVTADFAPGFMEAE